MVEDTLSLDEPTGTLCLQYYSLLLYLEISGPYRRVDSLDVCISFNACNLLHILI